MKGLDTPVLLGLLRGDPRVVGVLRKLSGEELCTTTINLFELEVIARQDPSPGRERRLSAIDRLRRKLTILPLDEPASEQAACELSRAGPAAPAGASSWLILGCLLAGRCSEWITVSDSSFPSSAALKVSHIDVRRSKRT